MFLNQENRNRKQKRVFPTFHDKKHILIFGYIKKEKKEKQSCKESKNDGFSKRETIFQDTEKDQTWKNMWKSPREKETKKTKFFWGDKKKNSFAEVWKDFFPQRVWHKET